jgi:predicted signal transduction protein with EAL and GGDEF domain/CHASE2 domain-containing sensor protein
MQSSTAVETETRFVLSSGTSNASKKSWRNLVFSVLTRTILVALIFAASTYGFFRPIDDWLQGARFTLLDRPPTGNVVFLEIDAASLQSVGVWPWPRTIHAEIVDRLLALGAKSMAFDIDFSAASSPENDATFAAALKRAGGFAILGAFEQPAGGHAGTVVNFPIPELAESSDLVSVDVPLGQGNLVRNYPVSRVVGGRQLPSLGAALAGSGLRGASDHGGLFGINFAINLRAIDRISVADLLAGKVAADRLRGRDVIIGASAQELRDFFATPRFGLIPGGLVHALAAETLSQGVAMQNAPWELVAGVIAALTLLATALGHRISTGRWLFGAIVLAVAVEFGAYWLQREYALRIASAPIHLALLALVLSGVVSDLRLRRRLHAQSARDHEFMRAMLRQVIADDFDGVVIVDETGKILANSRLALDFLNASLIQTDAPTLPPALAKLAEDCFGVDGTEQSRTPASGQLSMAVEGRGLRYLDYVVTISSIDNDCSRRVACLTFRDVTERQAEQEQLKFLAGHDPSTGAWLRHELIRNMEIRDKAADAESMTLVLVELRKFSSITNSLGDAVGEHLLQSVLARLRAEGHEMVARIGDANFGLCVPNMSGRFAVSHLCRSLLDRLIEPYAISDRKITVGFDLGVSFSSTFSVKAQVLLTQARIAQAAARNGAVNGYEIFSPSMEEEFTEREWIETALRQALTRGQFSLDYQPQIDLASGECFGSEALIRWHHPERGLISPSKFIAVAEASGLIVDIGRWVIRTACQEAANWPQHLSVAVNVSPLQFESPEILGDVRSALQLSGLSPTRLTIEITESAFVSAEGETVALLGALQADGIGIALDDFGTGYSSLSYLDRLPVDKIKIDQSFVKRILDDAGAAAIVQSVLQLASKLDKTVVAEGVETRSQALLLKKFGCQAVQGFYFGRPMAAVDFRRMFTNHPKNTERAMPSLYDQRILGKQRA